MSLKTTFLSYLTQLRTLVQKIPESLFQESLSSDMLPLEVNAQVAANFLLRGYCPLLKTTTISIEASDSGKQATLQVIDKVFETLQGFPEVSGLNDDSILSDNAGFANIALPESEFVFRYIIPNTLFHMSMVYAVARQHQVPLSKGDFDGLHHYPAGFSFVPENN